MKRILVISNMYPSRKDPVYGTFIKNFVEGIQETVPEWEVRKIVIAGRSRFVWGKVFKYILFYVHIFLNLLCFRYDLVYVHIITHAILPLKYAALFRHFKLVFNVHGEDVLTKSRLAAYFFTLAIPMLEKAALIVVPSDYFKRKCQEILPTISEEKWFISPSGGIDIDVFRPSLRKNEIYTVGYVSRIARGKGWDIFLDAVSILNKKKIPLQAIVAGNGDEILLFQQKIIALELTNVKYLGGIPHKELAKIYPFMDVFIFPTCLEESLGLVGLEAMACGVPVIGTHIGGLTDYIQEKVNGFFFEVGDAESLANKILTHYLANESMRTKWQENAYLTAKYYDKKDVFLRLTKVLESL